MWMTELGIKHKPVCVWESVHVIMCVCMYVCVVIHVIACVCVFGICIWVCVSLLRMSAYMYMVYYVIYESGCVCCAYMYLCGYMYLHYLCMKLWVCGVYVSLCNCVHMYLCLYCGTGQCVWYVFGWIFLKYIIFWKPPGIWFKVWFLPPTPDPAGGKNISCVNLQRAWSMSWAGVLRQVSMLQS